VQIAELEARRVQMLGDPWSPPTAANTIGRSTTGSREAAMPGGMARRRAWESKRKAAGKPTEKPNMTTGPGQAFWHEFARYRVIELRGVPSCHG